MAKDTRERMLETTARLLQHRGYHGTALSDILEGSGAPRGSLYFHFPGGKEELAVEATRASIEGATVELRDCLAQARGPAQGVRAYVDAAAQLMRDSDYTFGCPVAPVILDAAAGVEPLAALCRAAFQTWTDMLQDAFVDAGMARRRAASLALLVVSSIEGLLLIARAYRDVAPLTQGAVELEAAVAAALPRRGRSAKESGSWQGRRRRPTAPR
jgi:TetR/AcrR family transcriptional regulator, lmrAB and yxaGH operons repressor